MTKIEALWATRTPEATLTKVRTWAKWTQPERAPDTPFTQETGPVDTQAASADDSTTTTGADDALAEERRAEVR